MSDFVKLVLVILVLMGLAVLMMDGTTGALAVTGW